jgi:hypothetical protein
MRRYTALALDNIRREPLAFLAASAGRAVGMFVISGGSDLSTSVQFRGSGLVYAAGRALSALYLTICVVGLAIARSRRLPLFTIVVPLVYVPLTICFMLINARYSTSIQPFLFVPMAVAIVSAVDRFAPRDVIGQAGGTSTATAARR